MGDYIARLERTGMSAHEACRLVFDFLKNFTHEELEEFILEREDECYVDRIQS